MSEDPLKARTDAKLRYARIHVEELRARPPGRGHDFERSRQEAFFAQLFGAYAALLQELNVKLGCNLTPEDVTPGKLYQTLKSAGRSSGELAELHRLENDHGGWFRQAKDMRDHTTHVSGLPLVHYVGGPEDGTTSFRHPKTLTEVQGDTRDVLASWVSEMETLVLRMRV